jgi:2-iminobutanoate/2-iminopropanoate deaminase
MKTVITTDKAPRPLGPYSQGVKTGSRIYVAGQGPMNVATGVMPEGIKAQTIQVLDNIRAILDAGGAGMDDVVKTTVHLADLNLFKEFNEVYATYFKAPYPVRTTVASGLLGILVEIDVIAELG